MRLLSRLDAREARFSARVLRSYSAAALPELLGLRAAAGDAPAEILLYDEIGYWGITAKDFAIALAQCGDGPVHVRINSPGGDAFDGMAIYNLLRARTAPVFVTVDGIAASAASFIAMAGQTVNMPDQAMLMIHNAWGLCIGNRHDMTQFADVMQKIDGQIAEIYAAKSGKPVAEFAAAMDAETYYTSQEAKGAGLCDRILAAGESAVALAGARIVARSLPGKPANVAVTPRADALPPYDPDGDGDNDAQEALGYLQSAGALIAAAAECLTGGEDDDDDDNDGAGAGDMPLVPGNRAKPNAAATEPEWVVGGAEDLPIDESDTWDGPAAAERMLDAAGFNGDSPDPAKAKRGFLAWDHHNPKLKGSYKLPFADIVGGELKAVKGGIDAAASRLPQSDIPEDVQARARAVLDRYEKRMNPDKSALAARQRRLRLAEAEAA